jgi:hypothetical protein
MPQYHHLCKQGSLECHPAEVGTMDLGCMGDKRLRDQVLIPNLETASGL